MLMLTTFYWIFRRNMWYYVKDSQRVGPLSDAAMAGLVSSGKIDKKTKVWTPHQKGWCPLEQSFLYRSLSTERGSRHLAQLDKITHLFRAMLVVLVVCLGYQIFFLSETLGSYFDFLGVDDAVGKLEVSLVCAENAMLNSLVSLFIFGLFAATAVCGFNWMKSAMTVSKLISKRFPYSVTAATWSFFIPILNLIVPYGVVMHTLASSMKGRRFGVWHFTLVFMWGLFWSASLVLLFASVFLIPSKCPSELIVPFYYAKILVAAVYVVTALLTLAIASVVYAYQRRYLGHFTR